MSLASYAKTLPLTAFSATEYSLSEFANDLIDMAQSNPTSNNIVIPVLQTFNMLFEEDALVSLSESERGTAW